MDTFVLESLDVRSSSACVFDLLVRYSKRNLFRDVDCNEQTWTDEQQSEFIEACLMRVPIQPLYFYEHKAMPLYSVADGKQRLIALKKFYRGELTLTGLILNPVLNGKKFGDLAARYQGIFEDTQVNFYYINIISTPAHIVESIIKRIKG